MVHLARLQVCPYGYGAACTKRHQRYGERILARIHAEAIVDKARGVGGESHVAGSLLEAHDVWVHGEALDVA